MSRFKTEPFAHQLAEIDAHAADRARALFWEMGTGKTKAAIDTAASLWRGSQIDGLLVLAPNGVHGAWVADELPAHLPDDVSRRAMEWRTRSAATKKHAAEFKELLASPFLAVLAMSYDGFRTLAGRKAVEEFLRRRRALYVLDESQKIKSPSAKRTISVIATGRRAAFKRILTGTPVTRCPFDVYSQLKFLDEGFWAARGFASYEAFKTHFGVWVDREARAPSGKLGRFSQVVDFKNLDELQRLVGEVSSRVLKEDALDLPPKIYEKRYHELTDAQARVYSCLRDEFLAELEGGTVVTAPLMVTRLLRLQEIVCGRAHDDATGAAVPFDDNPRLRLLEEVLDEVEGSAIVFARFRADVDAICSLLGPTRCVRYDGAVDEDERRRALEAFQDGRVPVFVGNPAVAGTGLTLHRASTVVYYSNSFALEDRLQSEDRAHRIGQARPVVYVDLICRGTVDQHVVKNLRSKVDFARQVTGDRVREWL